MENRRLRVAVVGTGFVATDRHLPIWAKQREAELVAVSDVNEEAAKRVAARFNVPLVFTEIEKMLEVARPDVVDLCTPPRTHFALANLSMERGCDVLLEKPMAATYEECRSLVEKSASSGRKLCVIHNMLFSPPMIRALEMTQMGQIGEFRGMRILVANPVSEYLGKDSWVHKLPGGLIGETGPHAIYLSLAFIGKAYEIYAHRRKMADYPWSTGDDFIIDLVGQRGSSSIRVVHNSNHWAVDVELWGTEGRLKIDLLTMTLTQYSRESLKLSTIGWSVVRESASDLASAFINMVNTATGKFKSGHRKIIDEFIKSVSQGTEVPVTPESAAETVHVLEEVVKQLEPTQ